MRLGSLFALVCLLGCKTQPTGATASVETPQATAEASEASAPEEPEPLAALGGDEANGEDPEQRFCEKLTQLMVASRGTNPDAADRQELVDTCVTNARRKRDETPAAFDREVECISSAADLGAFFDCALDDPVAAQAGSDERFGPLCEKLAKLARNEPDLPEGARRNLQDTAQCAADARMEHDAAPRAFEQIERCILAATAMRGAAECTAAGGELR